MIAVMQRTSLGVAGVAATERFGSSATILSSLAVVQLMVYAAMQIPVGVLIDRYGPRILMLSGTSLMVLGQLTLAIAPTVSLAVVGRVLVGAGDATIFIAMIRLASSWFSGKRVPQLSQWLGMTGQLGQVLSALPLAWVLRNYGWEPAFVSAAACGVLAFAAIALCVRDRPADSSEEIHHVTWHGALTQLIHAFRRPGTRLGFWAHFVTQSSVTVFILLWGFPFLVFALGYTEQLASGLLVMVVAATLIAGPTLGVLSARYPLRRSNIVIGIVVSMAIAWAAVLLWPGVPPLWLIIVLIVVISVGGPGSLIGFDFARTFNPQRGLGSANGVVNVGGFLASFVMMYLIGVLIDVQDSWRVAGGGASDLYSLDSFKVAFSVQFLVIGLGMVFLLRERRRTREQMSRDEGIEVAPLWVSLVRAWKRRG